MPLYSHIMVDIETTGLSPDHNAMIQLTAISFDPVGRQIDHAFFDQCLEVPPTRFWDESTRNWWLDKPDTLLGIYQKMRDPATVMKEFQDWCQGQDLFFWSKPLSFDYPFVQSYFREFGPASPFKHWLGRDLRSVLMGLNFPNPPLDTKDVEFVGEEHNALFDVLHQIKTLFMGLETAKGIRVEILVP